MSFAVRGTLAALRNYASLRMVRQNSMAISAAMFIVLLLADMPSATRKVGKHGLAALFMPHSPWLTPIWLAGFFVPAMLIHHYWRQVQANLAPAVPGLIAAEYRAAVAVLLMVLPLLAAPLLWLGAPAAGALALAGLAMAGGGGFGRSMPTGQGTGLRRLRGLLFMPMLLVGLKPGLLKWIVFASAPKALGLLAVAVAAIVLGLVYRPAQAVAQQEQQEQAQEAAARRLRPMRRDGAGARFRDVLTWQLPNAADDPVLPAPSLTPGLALGPAGTLLLMVVQCAVLITGFSLIAMIGGTGWHRALADQGPSALSLATAASLLPRTQWLLNRGEWPFLVIAGRFGSRRAFADAVFRAHRHGMLQVALFSGLVATAFAVWLGFVGWAHAAPAVLIIAGLVFGAGYTPSLPLLWREFGGRGFVIAAGTAGYMVVMFTMSLGIFAHGVSRYAALVAAVLAAYGIVMAVVAPRLLARMDWPIEENPAPQ